MKHHALWILTEGFFNLFFFFLPFSFFNRLTGRHKNTPKKVCSYDIHLLFLFSGTISAQLEQSGKEGSVNSCTRRRIICSDLLITDKTQPIQRPSLCPKARFALHFLHTYFWTHPASWWKRLENQRTNECLQKVHTKTTSKKVSEKIC